MIDAINRAVEEVSKTTPTVMISATTATSGAVGYFHYAVWHDALSLLAMAAGILSCLVLTAVNVVRLIKIMRNEKAPSSLDEEE